MLNFFQKLVSLVNTLWILLGWFGWKSVIISSLTSIGISVWAFMQGLPTSIIGAMAFCIFVQAMYLSKLYEFTNTAHKSKSPNLDIWKHRDQFKLCEAACILADVEPDLSMSDPNARAWFGVLCEAIKQNNLPRITTAFDPQHTFVAEGYVPYNETLISKESFIEFARRRNPKCRFFRSSHL